MCVVVGYYQKIVPYSVVVVKFEVRGQHNFCIFGVESRRPQHVLKIVWWGGPNFNQGGSTPPNPPPATTTLVP